MKTDSQNSSGCEMDTHMQDLQKLMLPVKLWDCLTYGLINKFPKQVSEEWLGNAWCKKIPPEGSAAWFVPRPPKMQKHQRGDLLADAVCPGEEVPPLSGPAEYLLMLLQSSFPTDRCKLLIKKSSAAQKLMEMPHHSSHSHHCWKVSLVFMESGKGPARGELAWALQPPCCLFHSLSSKIHSISSPSLH